MPEQTSRLPRQIRVLRLALPAALLLAGLVAANPWPVRAQAPDAGVVAGAKAGGEELAFIERLYREGEDYRAEGEALRFLHARPAHPRTAAVELARAKLYYREGRYEEASLMLYSLLDRHPRDAVAEDARRLLTFTHLRRGDLARAARTAEDPEALRELAGEPPGAVDGEAARRWSTWLPGSGWVLVDRPGRAATGISLNVALVGAVAASVAAVNLPAAALFLVLEGMLWQGGRDGVLQEAQAINTRLAQRRLEAWLAAHGEPELLAQGLALRTGAP